MRAPIRSVVIGAGGASTHLHLPQLARLRDEGRLTLTCVCDLDARRAAAARTRFGFLSESGDGLAALARPDIDAVYIFGSAQLHFEYGLAALCSGKHLFVEKPIAPSYAQACELSRAAQAGGLVAAGGHNRRFQSAFTELARHAGDVPWRYAEAVFHKPEWDNPALYGARTWLSANGIHALDALVFAMGGLPEQLTALAGGGKAEPKTFSALMRWQGGAQGVFLCDNAAGARREEYAFHSPGETWRITEAGLVRSRDDGTSPTELAPADDGIAAEHAAFLAAIREGAEPAHSIATLAPSLFLAELIEAGFSGPVRLPSPTSARPPQAKVGSRAAILVVNPASLQSALAPLLPRHPLVSLADVEASPTPRKDIAAVILGPGSPPLAPAVIAKLPNLTIVGVVGLSLARHDPQAWLARGVTLVNASDAYAEGVAEFALGLAILGRRAAFRAHERMRRGGWRTDAEGLALRGARALRPLISACGLESPLLRIWRRARPAGQPQRASQRELQGSVAGLIGWGANARAFALRLAAAKAQVLVWSEHAGDEDIRAAGARPATLGEVLAADIVSLHRGLTRQTRHSLGAAELSRLRPGAVLINVARGALIEPKALVARLRRGDVFACLDTFEDEPLAKNHPLRGLPNVFLTPHIAGGSADMLAAGADEVIAKVARHLDGEAVDAVEPERLATMT